MSKTIEFVNRKIKDKKDQLKRLEKLKVTSNKYELQINELLTKNIEEDIEHLEKIKCELEAWEVMEKHLEYFPSDFYNGIPEELITMTSLIGKKDYHIIIKALEIKDERTNN